MGRVRLAIGSMARLGWVLALAGVVFAGLMLAPLSPAPAGQQQPQQRIWRLAGIYIAETSGSPQAVNLPRFMTIRYANSEGGSGDIEVKNRAGQVMFRQRFSWRFSSNINTIGSGNSVTQGLQFAFEGEQSTTNANGASFNGDGSGSSFPTVYMPPARAARFDGAVGIPVSSSARNNIIALDGTTPTSAMGSFYIPDSPASAGRQWAAMWFTVTLHNGEGNSTIQLYEIHYVFTTDGVPPDALPGPGELPPGVAYFPPTGGISQPLPPRRPPPGGGGGGGGAGSFPDPRIGGVPVDWCLDYGRGCGQPAADAFCASQGMGRAIRWSQAPVDRAVIIGTGQMCQGQGRCNALRDLVCTPAGGNPPPPLPQPPPQPQPQPPSGLVPLKLYYGAAREDNFTTGTQIGEQSAIQAGYRFARIEGYGYAAPQPGTVPLKLYWHPGRGDNFSTASAMGERAALSSGYQFVRIEAYIYPGPTPGTVPLQNYYSAARGDNFATATPEGEQSARAFGYGFAWTEGYVIPAR